jgi:sugar phosphate isomerase/epimerase
MKFAICNETFQDWPFDKAFAFARDCGYTGVEIAPFTIDTYATNISPAKRAEITQQAKAAGLEVIGLHWLLAKTEGF